MVRFPLPIEERIVTSANNVAQRLRQARKSAQLTPIELRAALEARNVTLSKAGLHRLENTDSTNPNLKLIEAWAAITHHSPGWLLFGTGTPTSADDVGSAIRKRVIDTIELMVGALDQTPAQEKSISAWLASIRKTKPKKVQKP